MPSQPQTESDNSYTGFTSRLDPAMLPPGILQAAQNVRLQRGIAQPRKGCKRLTDPDLNSLTMVGSAKWVDSLGRDNVALIFTDSLYLFRPAQSGYAADTLGPYNFTRSIDAGQTVDAVQALNKLFIFRGQADATVFTATVTNSAINNNAFGTVTVTTSSNHGYASGDEVTVRSSTFRTQSALDENYIITVTDFNTFTFEFYNTTGGVFAANTALTGFTTIRGKPPFIWDSNTLDVTVASQKYTNPSSGTALTFKTVSVPPADFGIYFQNRLVVKTANQQISVSDVLSEQFDLQLNVFLINQGGNDWIVGFLPWIENQFLVFMRNSINLAFIDPRFNIADADRSQITVVTNELGCIARRSIVNAGQYVLFLSSKGVYLLTPQLDLKVIGNTMPLSEGIADFFDNLDYSKAANSVANYYNNRFYIAVPVVEDIDPSPVESRNNRILIYNLLNKNWESIDVYPHGLNADNLIVSAYLYEKRLLILTDFNGSQPEEYGGVFLEGENDLGDQYTSDADGVFLPANLPIDLNAGAALSEINAFVRTREFTSNTLSEKRFSRAEFQFNNVFADTVKLSATSHDPDASEEILAYTFSGATDGTLRPRVAMRGSSIDFTIQFSSGRPALKGVTVHSIAANRPMISQE